VKWQNFRLINVSTEHTILEESYCAHILILHHDIKSHILPTRDNAISIPTAPLRDM
jgi:hypothetical protein